MSEKAHSVCPLCSGPMATVTRAGNSYSAVDDAGNSTPIPDYILKEWSGRRLDTPIMACMADGFTYIGISRGVSTYARIGDQHRP